MNLRLLVVCCTLLFALAVSACQPAPAAPSSTATPAPTPTLTITTLVGRPVNGGDKDVYRVMEDGHLRFIADWLTFLALGYQPNDLVTIPETQLQNYPLAAPLTRWITGEKDQGLYFLQKGQRYRITSAAMLSVTGGSPLSVSVVSDDFLNSFPLAIEPLLGADNPPQVLPSVTAARWSNGALWVAKDDGTLTRLQPDREQADKVQIPGGPVIDALAESNGQLYAGTRDGGIWQIAAPDQVSQLTNSTGSCIASLVSDGQGLWYADVDYYDWTRSHFHSGRGLIYRAADGKGKDQVYTLDPSNIDPLKNITVMLLDTNRNKLWIGTRFSGLLSFDLKAQTWERYNTFTKAVPDNHINDIGFALDGSLWLAMPAGLGNFADGKTQIHAVPDDVSASGVLSLSMGETGTAWASGDNYVAWFSAGGWKLYSAFDDVGFMDTFRKVALDARGTPWFVGDQHILNWDGQGWVSYDPHTLKAVAIKPGSQITMAKSVNFPAPQTDYRGWLQAWPRPAHDNGRGMHYLVSPSNDAFELRQQIVHLKQLHVRWALVNYTSRSQLPMMAKAFTEAGIMVIWRPYVRPYREYAYWAKDVAFLRMFGLPPYIQVYNEPSLGQEWEDTGRQVDQAVYLGNLLPAMRQVYDAGGYVGLQEIDLDWLRTVLRKLKDNGATDIFNRLFFIPHAYGYNHPPDFNKDVNSVLGFRDFAKVFQEEIGFVPMMVAGEGGWRPGEAQDIRYPMVTQTLHRDYFLAVFNWFRNGQLSDGEPLPDYLFAFCPWILSDPTDPAAWFDSSAGDRILTIQAIDSLPDTVRKFSWDAPTS